MLPHRKVGVNVVQFLIFGCFPFPDVPCADIEALSLSEGGLGYGNGS